MVLLHLISRQKKIFEIYKTVASFTANKDMHLKLGEYIEHNMVIF
jgi:hypothetical protein